MGIGMAKEQSKIRNWAEYLTVQAIAFVLNWLPAPVSKGICRVLADTWRLVDRRHREMAVRNSMERLGLDEKTARLMIKNNYRHYAYLVLELSWLLRMSLDDAQKTADCVDLREKILKGLAAGKGLVFLTGHLGNWEWASLLREGHYPHTRGFIARPLKNPLVDDMVRGMRERGGGKVWQKQGAIRKALGALRDGGMIVAVVDQNGGRHGTVVPFLGKNASTMAAPIDLAIRVGSPIIVGALLRTGEPGTFRISVADLIWPNPGADPAEERVRLLTLANRDFGEIIRQFPEQWIWIHNRWKEYGNRDTPAIP